MKRPAAGKEALGWEGWGLVGEEAHAIVARPACQCFMEKFHHASGFMDSMRNNAALRKEFPVKDGDVSRVRRRASRRSDDNIIIDYILWRTIACTGADGA